MKKTTLFFCWPENQSCFFKIISKLLMTDKERCTECQARYAFFQSKFVNGKKDAKDCAY